MTTPQLGRLESVSLRDYWHREDMDFTPWLADPQNLGVLSDTLGMSLESVGQEVNVGPFRADILCRNTDDSTFVLIENQLADTNHTHLGQLLTYAAGLQTVTIIWIAGIFTDEHRAALDWLNDITAEGFRFFGIEVELWKIGGSQAAPKFNIVSRPNNWSKSARQSVSAGSTPADLQHQLFWTELRRHLEEEKSDIRLGTPPARYWAPHGLGKTGFILWAVRGAQQRQISVELRLDFQYSKAHFGLLEQQKTVIESEIGSPLTWREQPSTTVSRILLSQDADPTDETDWPAQIGWFAETLKKFDQAFRQRAQNLDPEDWVPPSEPVDQ